MTTPTNPLALPAPGKAPERAGPSGPSLSERVRSLRLPDAPRGGGGGGTSWLAWLLVVGLAAGASYLGYRLYMAEQLLKAGGGTATGTATSTPPKERDGSGTTTGGPIRTANNSARSLETGGYLIPVQRVQVSPRVGGQVIKMFYEEGEWVEAGMPLAIIDRVRFNFTYRERKAQADALKAEWERMQSSLRLEEKVRAASVAEGEANVRNMQVKFDIARKSGTSLSEEDRTNATYQYQMAAARLENLKALLQVTRETSEAEIERAYQNYQQAVIAARAAEDDLDNTVVPAPSSGIILKKYAEDGNMVRPEAFSNGLSASLYDLADLSLMEVDVDISERDLDAVYIGQKCEIRMEAFPDRLYTGTVERMLPEANRSKASVSARVRVDVPPGDRYLRPELRARVKFLPKSEEKNARK